MSARELLALAGVHADERPAAEAALSLLGAARDAALCDLRSGPRLAAALELGRRAWMLPSPAGRRVRAPVDIAAICAPRFVDDDDGCLGIALDRRLTVARLARTTADTGSVLRLTLGAGVTRIVLGMNRRGDRAVPTTADVDWAAALHAACALVQVALIDVVLLGDDGFSSLLRLGMLPSQPDGDTRYR